MIENFLLLFSDKGFWYLIIICFVFRKMNYLISYFLNIRIVSCDDNCFICIMKFKENFYNFFRIFRI